MSLMVVAVESRPKELSYILVLIEALRLMLEGLP